MCCKQTRLLLLLTDGHGGFYCSWDKPDPVTGTAAPVCLFGKLCYCSQHHGNDQGKDLYVCVCFAPEIIKVSVLWGDGAGYSDGSAVGLPRGFADTSRGGGRAVAVRAGGRGRRAATSLPVGITPGNSMRDSLPGAAIFPGLLASPSMLCASAR